jgi:hypothetical protein
LALTVGGFLIPGTAEAAGTKRVEEVFNKKISNHQPANTARGTLFFRHIGINPYTHEREVSENELPNPLVYTAAKRLTTASLRGAKFGYIDVVSPQPRTVFMAYDSKTMLFVPAGPIGSTIRTRQVKFYTGRDGRLDYSQPVNSKGVPYHSELFGISTRVGQTPSATPPTY